MSKDYFASDPNPGGASSGADYFADDPVPVVDDSIKPTLTTDQGTSLIPIEGGDFFNMLSSYANRIGIANLPLEAQAQMLKDQGEESPVIEAQNQLEKTLKLFTQENLRIENVLTDKFGVNYAGDEAVGDISLNVRDGLARRNKFTDRLGYFKRMYPEGKYYRTDVGGGKVEELYQLTKDGQIFRVDPNGGFSDFAGDFGDFLGTVATGATAGTIVGSFFSPILGTALGSLTGQMLDDYFTGEDITYENGREFLGDVLSGDKVGLAAMEGVLNRVIPGLGRYMVNKMQGKEGVPLNFATKSTAAQALQAQKFAEKAGLPLLSIAQLTDSKVIKKLTNQLMGTSDLMSKKMTKQNLAIFNKLKGEVTKDFESASQANLVAYLDLQKKKLLDDAVIQLRKTDPDSTVGQVDFTQFVKDVGNFKEGYDTLINRTFTLAMQTAKKDNVVFNLKNIQETAENVLVGIQGKLARKDKKGNNIYQRIGGELQGDIRAMINQLKSMDENVSTIAVNKFGQKRVFDSLKQMLAVRNKLSEIAGEAGDKNAIELIKALDNTLENPISGGTSFLKYLKEARQLTKDKADIVNYTSLAQLFDRKGNINITKTMDGIFDGKTNAEDINLLVKFMNVASGVNERTGKRIIQKNTADMMKTLQDGFVQYILQQKDNAGKVISDLKIDKKGLYEKLIPHEPTRKELEKLALKQSQLSQSGAVKALKQDMDADEATFKLLAGSTAKEIKDQIAERGGMNGKLANDLRRAILNKIMKKSGILEQGEGSGELLLNTPMFSKALSEIEGGVGEFAQFRSLFPKKYVKALQDRRLYSFFVTGGTDAGADIATGAVVGQLRQGRPVEFAKTMFISTALSKFLSKAPSVEQLQRIHDTQPLFGRRDKVFGAMTAMLTSMERELGLDFLPLTPETGSQEDLGTEVERTGKSPEMGDKLSQSSITPNTITPNTLNLNLPAVSGGGSVGSPPSSTNFASLFPFDTTGSAISSRAGIGSLV